MMDFPPRERPPGLLDRLLPRVRFFLNRRDIEAARHMAEETPERDLCAVLSIYARAIPANTNALSDLVYFIERFERTAGLKAHAVLGLAPGEKPGRGGGFALSILRAVAEAARKGDREAAEKGPTVSSALGGREMTVEELTVWLERF